jgi:mono/diheme cytochrome c family protein
MPAYTGLSRQEVNDLVDYLLHISEGATAAGAKQEGIPPSKEKAVPGGEDSSAENDEHAAMKQRDPGPASFVIGSAAQGEILFGRNCTGCHGAGGRGGVINPGSSEGVVPTLSPIDADLRSSEAGQFARHIDVFIQHGSVPAGPKPALQMPDFGDSGSLTQEEIANIEAYILSLNGVDRGQLVNPGMQPRWFFGAVMAVYLVVFLVQGGVRFKKRIS